LQIQCIRKQTVTRKRRAESVKSWLAHQQLLEELAMIAVLGPTKPLKVLGTQCAPNLCAIRANGLAPLRAKRAPTDSTGRRRLTLTAIAKNTQNLVAALPGLNAIKPKKNKGSANHARQATSRPMKGGGMLFANCMMCALTASGPTLSRLWTLQPIDIAKCYKPAMQPQAI